MKELKSHDNVMRFKQAAPLKSSCLVGNSYSPFPFHLKTPRDAPVDPPLHSSPVTVASGICKLSSPHGGLCFGPL